jgi:hypothetical protein
VRSLWAACYYSHSDLIRRTAAHPFYEAAEPVTTSDPATIAKRNQARYIRGRDNGHADYVKDAARFDGIYTGESHWDPSDKAKLDKEGRPALTFNMVLAVINTALGAHIKRDVQITFKPRRRASAQVASVLNKLTMQILHANRFKYLEMAVAADGLIQDRGFYDIRMDFTNHMAGEVKITAVDPTTVVLDIDAKEYDPATWNEVSTTRWMSLDDIAGTYTKAKADEIKDLVAAGDNFRHDSVKFEENTFGKSQSPGSTYVYNAPQTKDTRDIRSVRVIERQHYQWTMERMFVDPDTGDMAEVPGNWDDAKAEAFAQQTGALMHKRPGRRVRWTVSADQVLLYDDWSLYETFTIVPFFPYFRRGRPFGMVRNLVGPQEYLNKARSQELHIVNTTANSGWTLEEGSLVNMTEDEFALRGAETGLVLVHARGTAAPAKIMPNSVPSGIDRISEKAAFAIREISGVNDGMLGFAAASVSGVALNSKTEQGSIQLEVPARHMELSRRILAEKILNLVQNFYTEERVVHCTYDANPGADEEQVMVNTQDAAGQIINDVTRGEYDVVIATTPARDNFDEGQFADLLEMRMNGIAIPDTVIIRHSNLVERDQIADAVEKLLGQAEPSEQEIQMMQAQQQLQIQTAQAELAKLQAAAESLQTGSALNMAKASQIAGGNDSPEMQLQRDELESRIALKREELNTRVRLAQLTHTARASGEQLRSAVDLARTRFQGEVQLESSKQSKKAEAKKPASKTTPK